MAGAVSVRLRVAASALALVAGAAAVNAPMGAPHASTAGGRIAVPGDPGYPSPPPGSLVLSREAGTYALAVAVRGRLVRVSVLSDAGPGKAGLNVRVGRIRLTPCGPGCYQAAMSPPHRVLVVSLDGKSYPLSLPPRTTDGTAIMARAGAVWRALRTLVWREHLGSSPTVALDTIYQVVAPDELAYQIRNGGDAVIIGTRRWDRARRGRWVRSAQTLPVRQPVPYWQTAPHARVIAVTTFDGRPVWRISFFDPRTPAWFTADVDRRTYRTLELDMIAAAHFMHDVYGPFDAPIRIAPPTR